MKEGGVCLVVNLTSYEKELLSGKHGLDKKKAMEFMVEYAVALNAEKLIEIKSVAGGLGSSKHIMEDLKNNNYDLEKMFCEYKLNTSEKVKINEVCVPTTTLINLLDPKEIKSLEIDEEVEKYSLLNENYAKKIGMQVLYTCAPYLSGFIPMYGEHVAWMESSAVVMANSVFGARTNTESLESTGAASIIGRVPYWGLHIKENRYATYHIKVEGKIDSEFKFGLLGYYIGSIIQEKIPVITGIERRPKFEELKHFGAALAVSGGVELYHIVGVTPEANTLSEALGNREPKKTLVVTEKDLYEVYKKINFANKKGENKIDKNKIDENKIDFVLFGCPHSSLEQVKNIVQKIEGKKINKDVKMWILLPLSIKVLCDRQGYTKKLEDFGAKLLTDICPAISGLVPKSTKAVATNSIKQAHYLINLMNLKCSYGSLEECILSSISGKWEGEYNDYNRGENNL